MLVGHGLDTLVLLSVTSSVSLDAFTHLVCPISGLEIDGGGPVVGKVLIELAAGAARDLGDVGHSHGGVEGILGEVSTHTVVRGGGERRNRAWGRTPPTT